MKYVIIDSCRGLLDRTVRHRLWRRMGMDIHSDQGVIRRLDTKPAGQFPRSPGLCHVLRTWWFPLEWPLLYSQGRIYLRNGFVSFIAISRFSTITITLLPILYVRVLCVRVVHLLNMIHLLITLYTYNSTRILWNTLEVIQGLVNSFSDMWCTQR